MTSHLCASLAGSGFGRLPAGAAHDVVQGGLGEGLTVLEASWSMLTGSCAVAVGVLGCRGVWFAYETGSIWAPSRHGEWVSPGGNRMVPEGGVNPWEGESSRCQG